MPVAGIITPIEFATAEWDKLARAWRQLNPTERDRQLQRHLNDLRDQGKLKLYPELPGWDDVLKLGDSPPHLTSAELIARKKAVRVRIQQSTTPLEQKAIANIINAIDDVQDLASFTGLVARLVLRAAPRIAVKAVPILGWIATASDVLNLLSFLSLTAGVALGIRSEGPLAGAAAIAGPAFAKAALKREMWTMLRKNRNAVTRTSATTKRLAEIFAKDRKLAPGLAARYAGLIGKRVGFSELLEAGQAVETLTGFGLSLGAIMGYLSDASWALYRDVTSLSRTKTQTLARAIGKVAPSEFIIELGEENYYAFNFSEIAALGPAYPSWREAQGDRALRFTGALELGLNYPASEIYCYTAHWIQHPRYPREPDSLVAYAVSNYPPGLDFVREKVRAASLNDIIVRWRPAVNGRCELPDAYKESSDKEFARLVEALRQNPRNRTARKIQRRLMSLLLREQRKLIKAARDREREAKRLRKEEARARRAREAATRAAARAELAARKKAIREAGKRIKEPKPGRTPPLPEVPPGLFDAYQAGTLADPLVTMPATDDAPETYSVTTIPTSNPTLQIPLATFCDIADALGVTLSRQLQTQCAIARGQLVKRSPWRTVGIDRPPDWPRGAASMAPELVRRAAHTLTSLPRLLGQSPAPTKDEETYYLTHGLAALRILHAAGVSRTFAELAPFLPAYTVRAHRQGGTSPLTCPARPCIDPG